LVWYGVGRGYFLELDSDGAGKASSLVRLARVYQDFAGQRVGCRILTASM